MQFKQKIAVLDTSKYTSEIISNHLKKAGYKSITCFQSIKSLQEAYKAEKSFETLISEYKIHGKSIVELKKWFERYFKSEVPQIITVSKIKTIDAKKHCYNNGIDEYIDKPFHPDELLMRIDKLSKTIKRYQFETEEVALHPTSPILKVNQTLIRLTKREYLLLDTLIKGNSHTTHDKLSKVFQMNNFNGSVNSIRITVHRLRKKLQTKLSTNHELIISLHGQGYYLDLKLF